MGELGELPRSLGMTGKLLTQKWVSLGELGAAFAETDWYDREITHPAPL